MRKWILTLLAVAGLAGAGAAGLANWPVEAARPRSFPEGDVGRGAYLARMAGCIACHTESEGGRPLAGGLALKTEFGTFYSPNLTTDREHGIGAWTLGEFATALRQGISPKGEPYYPAFPYPFYSGLSDRDIADLWAAFQTVPPVSVASREQDLKFPFNFRPGLKLWQAAFFDQAAFKPDEGKSAAWNRGKYIVRGPAHCGACHTPRNLAGARQAELSLHGAKGLPGGEKSPPITAAVLAEQGWTINALKYALRTGVKPDGDTFGGSMGEVVRDGTAFLGDDDLTAIATYLLDQDRDDALKR